MSNAAASPSLVRRALTYGIFPVVFFGSLLAIYIANLKGVHLGIMVPATTVTAGAFILVFERIHPYIGWWNETQGDVGTDIMHAIVSMGIVPNLFNALVTGSLYAFGAWLTGRVGTELWPVSWPIVIQLAMAMIITEFPSYWVHRWMHEHDSLWRLHATHHSAPRLYFLNAARFHPLDTLAQHSLQIAALAIMGAPEVVMALFVVWTSVHGMFQHANINMKLGPLNWIFSMAELHRWHHSRTIEESQANYGANIIFWDLVFGTYFFPKDRMPPEQIGIEGMPNFPANYVGQILSPFRWKRVVAESSETPATPPADATIVESPGAERQPAG
ncbi:sterol desaturase family protein [bacterium]|nr:sterol desaturase family protein [bacterium]